MIMKLSLRMSSSVIVFKPYYTSKCHFPLYFYGSPAQTRENVNTNNPNLYNNRNLNVIFSDI